MIGKTLFFYIAVRYFKSVIAMILGLMFLIVTVDFIEELRKASQIDDASIWQLYMISLLKAPVFLEKAFPFGCLFAAMMTLNQMNSKMELVVARAAGISAWQFLLPIGSVGIFLGIFVATAFNPVAILSQEKSKDLRAVVYSSEVRAAEKSVNGYWIRQEDETGSAVLNANLARDRGQTLTDVTIVRWHKDGALLNRIDATTALYRGDHWLLLGTKITENDGRVVEGGALRLKTNLRPENLFGASTPPESVPFWELREAAHKLEGTGGNSKAYLVQFHKLLSLPAFFIAMILIAAAVSLKFARFGQAGRMILGGILSGFVLYTISSLITSLGSNGIVPPAVAAWAPVCVAILFGMSILLHQEDG